MHEYYQIVNKLQVLKVHKTKRKSRLERIAEFRELPREVMGRLNHRVDGTSQERADQGGVVDGRFSAVCAV